MEPVTYHRSTGCFTQKSLPVFLIVFLAMSYPTSSYAEQLWANDAFANLCRGLPLAPRSQVREVVGNYADAIESAEGVSLDHLRVPEFSDVEPVIGKAISLHWGALEFFTDPSFANVDGCMLLFDRALLQHIDGEFNLHGLWMINPGAEAHGLHMQYLLLGNGKMIIGYNGRLQLKVPDYNIKTGRYNYEPFTAMKIVNHQGRRGLDDIHVRTSPASAPTPFIGPLNSEIRTMELRRRDGETQIVVSYKKWFLSDKEIIASIPIERR